MKRRPPPPFFKEKLNSPPGGLDSVPDGTYLLVFDMHFLAPQLEVSRAVAHRSSADLSPSGPRRFTHSVRVHRAIWTAEGIPRWVLLRGRARALAFTTCAPRFPSPANVYTPSPPHRDPSFAPPCSALATALSHGHVIECWRAQAQYCGGRAVGRRPPTPASLAHSFTVLARLPGGQPLHSLPNVPPFSYRCAFRPLSARCKAHTHIHGGLPPRHLRAPSRSRLCYAHGRRRSCPSRLCCLLPRAPCRRGCP